MGNSDDDNELAQRSSESDTDDWCPYCGEDGLEDKTQHIEDEHF